MALVLHDIPGEAGRGRKPDGLDSLREARPPEGGTMAEQLMTCPKCGFQQPKSSECVSCGIFVAKFLEKSRRDEEARIIESSIAERQVRYATSGPAEMEGADNDGDLFGPEKSGIQYGMAGGIVMMTIAVIWFGLGWMAGVIFYYPPILFLVGAFALLKGLVTGNVAGE
jgi:hypothetical protein